MRVIQFQKGQCCLKLDIGGYELSVAFDDSCGALPYMGKADIRIFKGRTDVTHHFEPNEGARRSEQDLYRIMQQLFEESKKCT